MHINRDGSTFHAEVCLFHNNLLILPRFSPSTFYCDFSFFLFLLLGVSRTAFCFKINNSSLINLSTLLKL